ncbi:thiol reductase thioredoxin [Halobacillus andaensis]|uniref:Thiol reductase thioredoxin n=1 Tax=Halobacillus andaensis TaxID=1176239 RepID=A0A917AY38_HALAA|nr:thioredoxin family protein [Halobacillus andaensis]MBP2002809.1 thiol-disulfide isomerase/thioredoxin [Halobacillus andaensis]GGF05866.1 thiol reductase thioredoxin [Halobacillus andaensis]
MINLKSDEQLNEIINDSKAILLFSADWCPDCRVIEPILPEVEEEFSDWTFVYVDRDQFIHICAENDVFGIPSFLAYNNGEEVGRFVSKDAKTKEEIEQFIKNLDV